MKEKIVDTALALAEERSWERVRLHQVAERLKIGLDQIQPYFREKEEIVDAWFDRADAAMLAATTAPELTGLSARERFARLTMVWLRLLAPHRRVTRQMIVNKLEPGHLHYQVLGLMRVSRTVQWLREGAALDAPLPWRALEETGLTSIYLSTFAYWMVDDSAEFARTERWLRACLERGERLAETVGPFFGRPRPVTESPRRPA